MHLNCKSVFKRDLHLSGSQRMNLTMPEAMYANPDPTDDIYPKNLQVSDPENATQCEGKKNYYFLFTH